VSRKPVVDCYCGLALVRISCFGCFREGNNLLQDCSQGNILFCYGYIDAITDVLRSEPVNGIVACVPSDSTANQLKDVVVQFLLLNPSVRHSSAFSLVAYTTSEAFPCRRR
jgi:hypothetical protein